MFTKKYKIKIKFTIKNVTLFNKKQINEGYLKIATNMLDMPPPL